MVDVRLRRQRVAAVAVLLVAGLLSAGLGSGGAASAHPGHEHIADRAADPQLPPGFRDEVVMSGLDQPVAAEQSPDGRVFVLEKRGVLKVFDSFADTDPTYSIQVETEVMNSVDRGALGFTLDPSFATNHFVYLLYTYNYRLGDADPGSVPYWDDGDDDISYDDCTVDPKYTDQGCEVTNRLVRYTINPATDMGQSPLPLITDWCQQYFSHSAGALAFGADGFLYASAGEGASYTDNENYDIGQFGNPCDDPMPPGNPQGGRVRAQDVRTLCDPTSLSGSVIRVNPGTGAPAPGNPLIANPSADTNARRMVAHGFRNPFRITIRPGTNDLYVGDVGESTYEEVNRIGADRTQLVNSGWPCFEGPSRYPNIRNDVPLCNSLADAAVTPPFFTYGHDEAVTAGESCATGTGSISALAFAQDDSFPAAPGPKGALVFGDYSRGCIWYLPVVGAGDPDPGNPQMLVDGADGPVDMFTGIDDSLYYVGIGLDGFQSGNIRRITYDGGRPVAKIRTTGGTQPYGDAPLTVQFDASESTDPNGDPLTYAWDLDGNGTFEVGPSAATTRTKVYPGTTNVTVRVRVSDGDSDDVASMVVYPGNHPPQLTIDSPVAGLRWAVGQRIGFSGTAQDEGSPMPAADVDWSVTMEHCPASCHSHPLLETPGALSGAFTTIDHELPSHILLRISATDARGLASTLTRRLDPAAMRVAFGTVPGGLRYSVNGRERTAAFAERMIAGAQVQMSTVRRQYRNGLLWRFSRWPVAGRPLSHTFALPRRDEYSYKATFVPVTHRLTVTTAPTGLAYSALRANRRGTFTRQVQVGTRVGVTAPRSQVYRGWRYVFVRWSDGGAASHSFRMPDADALRRAVYRRAGRA